MSSLAPLEPFRDTALSRSYRSCTWLVDTVPLHLIKGNFSLHSCTFPTKRHKSNKHYGWQVVWFQFILFLGNQKGPELSQELPVKQSMWIGCIMCSHWTVQCSENVISWRQLHEMTSSEISVAFNLSKMWSTYPYTLGGCKSVVLLSICPNT